MTGLPYLSGIRALCIGDVMIDRFVQGSVKRISPESPVPIVLLSGTDNIPGGAANVSRNIAALGGSCTLVGVVGADEAGAELGRLLSASGRITPALIAVDGRSTIEKTRFIAQGQQLLRVDREAPGDIPAEAEQAIIDLVTRELPHHQVVILSDYAKGVLTDRVVQAVIHLARARRIPVVVDPKSADLGRYAGATVVTPNARETHAATGVEPLDDAHAELAGSIALDRWDIGAILITRAERGMSLLQRDRPPVHVPASARKVFDVVGAGDTVVASLSLCLGAGRSLEAAAYLANAAAGIVVGKPGTATVTQTELLDELSRLSRAGLSSPDVKMLSWEEAGLRRRAWRRDGLTVGFTNGCFDILHVGHIRILEFARAQCDRLIVGINADASVTRLKGPGRPINTAEDRAQVLAALGFVDMVVIFDEDTPQRLIEFIEPDVLVKGADYTIDQIVGADTVLARGGKVLTCELVPGRSTTRIVEKASATKGTLVS